MAVAAPHRGQDLARQDTIGAHDEGGEEAVQRLQAHRAIGDRVTCQEAVQPADFVLVERDTPVTG